MRFRIIAVIAAVCLSVLAIHSTGLPENEPTDGRVGSERCPTRSFEYEFRDSKAVFTGKVTRESKNGDTRTFEIAVERYWKGPVGKRIEINSYETFRYQVGLTVGETYLVFVAGSEDGKYTIQRCSRSRVSSRARDDLQKLGKGKLPK